MDSLLQIVLLFTYASFTLAHETQLPQGHVIGGISGSSQQGQFPTPQVYIGNPGQSEIRPHGVPLTTVCVEIHSFPYPICGPQVHSELQGLQQFGQNQLNTPFKDLNKGNAAEANAQPLPSESKPIPTNQRQLLVSPQQQSWLPPQGYQRAVVMPQPTGILIPRQYIPPVNPNTVSTDGTLSMNCKVGGLKYPSYQESSSNIPSPSYTNLPVRFVQGPPNGPSLAFKSSEMKPLWMANLEGSSMWNTLVNPSGKSSTDDGNIHTIGIVPSTNIEQTTPSVDSIMEENKKGLALLKQQIAELNKMANIEQNSNEQQHNNKDLKNPQLPQQSEQQKPNTNANHPSPVAKSPARQMKS